ncbi:MAG: hypothetical protein Q8933_21215 [Bacteroidota bacterium]|nr:hypothetical protein [Bacteroidota bacterium]
MKQIKNHNMFKTVGLAAALFFTMSFAVNAQDRTMTQGPPSTDNSSIAQNNAFDTYASQFANDLAQQTGLSMDKADKIRKALVDYYNTIRDTKQSFIQGKLDSRNQNANNTTPEGMKNNNNNSNQDETGGRVESSNNDASVMQDLMSEYRKADEKADKDILDAFDNDSQKAKYVQVKRQWWQDVKNKVFSSSNQPSGQNSGAQETR